MSSVIGTSIARAPRTVRTKISQPGASKIHSQSQAGEAGYQIMSNAAEVLSYVETFVDENIPTPPTVLMLCSNLKAFGTQLEASNKEQLDQVFIHLRNVGRDEKLDKISRLHILEVIELRAGRWTVQEQTNAYYQSKLADLEECSYLEGNNGNDLPVGSGNGNTSLVSSPSSPPDTPLLLPGEVVKFSGKYTQLTKIPGKNFFKDEVVIRNADSGKVNPGANERLVQITGVAEDNIERAKQLIEQTILRNASPVRSCEPTLKTSTSENNDFDLECSQNYNISLIDPTLDEYQYTVTVGNHSIKITGQDFKFVQKAKLILDEYMGDASTLSRALSSCSSTDDGVFVASPNDSPRLDTNSCRVKYNRQSLMHWATSPLCQCPPPDFDKVIDHLPEIIRKASVTTDVDE